MCLTGGGKFNTMNCVLMMMYFVSPWDVLFNIDHFQVDEQLQLQVQYIPHHVNL